MTIDNPSPLTWSIDARQIRTEGPSQLESDDPYHEPSPLQRYIEIPGWGDVAYAGLADGSVTPIELPKGDPSVGTTCTDPVTGDSGVDPGMYSLLAADNDARRWLCPGVFHFVHKSGTEGLQLGTGSVVAGQGVTLVFENDSELRVDGGGALILNCLTSGKPECANPIPAPWRTGDTRHDLPITIWIEPVPGCDPRAAACGNSSTVFDMTAGAGMDIRGIIYGPTDDMKIAGNGDHHGSGEIWAWTITYAGNSTLDQVYEGSDDGYPLIVE